MRVALLLTCLATTPALGLTSDLIRSSDGCSQILTVQRANCLYEKHWQCPNDLLLQEVFNTSEVVMRGQVSKDDMFGNFTLSETRIFFETKRVEGDNARARFIETGQATSRAFMTASSVSHSFDAELVVQAKRIPNMKEIGGRNYVAVEMKNRLEFPETGTKNEYEVEVLILDDLNLFITHQTFSSHLDQSDQIVSMSFEGEPGFYTTSPQYNCGETS